jgi:two-component system, NarL family, response regulator DevR
VADLIRVLVVDDHLMFAQAIVKALSDESDVEVLGIAGTAAEAKLAVDATPPDIVLMDYDLPDGTGASTTEAIRATHPDTRVVMVTSFDDEQVLIDAIEAGCAGFVTKHKAIDEVVAAVRAAYAGEALISPSMLARLLPRLNRSYRGIGTDLTPREKEVLDLVSQGLSNQAIAGRLVISTHTVRNHVQNMLTKLHAHSKLEAVANAVREGIIRYP